MTLLASKEQGVLDRPPLSARHRIISTLINCYPLPLTLPILSLACQTSEFETAKLADQLVEDGRLEITDGPTSRLASYKLSRVAFANVFPINPILQ